MGIGLSAGLVLCSLVFSAGPSHSLQKLSQSPTGFCGILSQLLATCRFLCCTVGSLYTTGVPSHQAATSHFRIKIALLRPCCSIYMLQLVHVSLGQLPQCDTNPSRFVLGILLGHLSMANRDCTFSSPTCDPLWALAHHPGMCPSWILCSDNILVRARSLSM